MKKLGVNAFVTNAVRFNHALLLNHLILRTNSYITLSDVVCRKVFVLNVNSLHAVPYIFFENRSILNAPMRRFQTEPVGSKGLIN